MRPTSLKVPKCLASIGFVLFTALAPIRAADVLSHWNGGTGDWTNALNWTHTPSDLGADYPHNGLLTYDVQIDDGGITLDNAITLERLTMIGGYVQGNGSLSLNAGLQTPGGWIGIALSQLTIAGTSTWDATYLSLAGVRTRNRGTLDIRTPVAIQPNPYTAVNSIIENEGTIRFLFSNSPMSLDKVSFTNRGNVIIDSSIVTWFFGHYVQESGQTLIHAGTLVGQADIDILGGAFSIADAGTNQCGQLRVDSGISVSAESIVHTRKLILTNSSVVEIEIGPAGAGLINNNGYEFGLVDGTLRLRLANGFIPTVGTRYTLFTRLAPITQFPRHEGLEIGNGLRLVPHYEGNNLEIVVMNAPQPGQTALTLKRTPWWAPPTLSWPPEYAGFYLQYTTNFTNPDWTTLFVTWTNSVNISTAQRQGFFRLVQP